MMGEKSEAGAETGPVVHCGEQRTYSRNGAKKQSLSDAPLHLINGKRGDPPKVSVLNRGTETVVLLHNAPWGWGRCDRVFLHAPLHRESGKAAAYAAELRQRLADAAWKEEARREALRTAALREREQRK